DLANDPTSANFPTASVNNQVAIPAANSYNVFKDNQPYTVTQAEVDAGSPLTFKIGTREAGMFVDPFVFSTNDSLTEAGIKAFPYSGSGVPPKILKAVGSATLDTVTITFDGPLSPAAANISHFALSGNVSVTGALLNTNTSRDVVLTTSAQVAGR